MFDVTTMKYGFVIIGILSILSGIKLIVVHMLPPESTVGRVVSNIVDFLSANIKHS